jgi:hypothetical protein
MREKGIKERKGNEREKREERREKGMKERKKE